MPERWIKIFADYGPAGLFLFCAVVLLPTSWRFLKSATKAQTSAARFFFLLSAGSTIALLLTNVVVGIMNINAEVMIRGQLIGLEPTGDMKSPFAELFLQRVYSNQTEADFSWVIVSRQKLPPGTIIPLYLDHLDTPDHEVLTIYALPITDDFYRHKVNLVYDRETRRLLLQHGKDQVSLSQLGPHVAGIHLTSSAERQFQLVPSVYADQKRALDTKSMSERLESNDVIIRTQARSELGATGLDALTFIQEILANSRSSYRLRLGVLVALNSISGNQPALVPGANCAIVQAAEDPDIALREQGEKYISMHPNLSIPPNCNRKIAAPPLLQASKNLKSDPSLSATLILFDLSRRHVSNLPPSQGEKIALQNLVWSNGWMPTYNIGAPHKGINAVDISPDGKLLVTAQDDRTARLWEISTGKQARMLEGHRTPVQNVEFSHNGSMVATAGSDGSVKIWRVSTGDLLVNLQNQSSLIHIMFSPDDSRLVTQGNDFQVAVWNASDGSQLYRLPNPITSDHAVSALAYNTSGSILASGHVDGEISFWEAASGRRIGLWREFNGGIRTLTFSPSGSIFVTAAGNANTIQSKLIETEASFKAHRTVGTYSGDGKSVDLESGVFDADGKLLLVGRSSSDLKVWDATSRDDIVTLHTHREWRSGAFMTGTPLKLIVWNKSTVRIMPSGLAALVYEAQSHTRALSPLECNTYLNVPNCPKLDLAEISFK